MSDERWLRLDEWTAINLANVTWVEISRAIDQAVIHFRGGRRRWVHGRAAVRLQLWLEEHAPLEGVEVVEAAPREALPVAVGFSITS